MFCLDARYNLRHPQEEVLHTRATGDVTVLLQRWRDGSPEAEGELMVSVQHELHRLAQSYLRRERGGHTLQPTAIVNEAYLRLVPQRGIAWENRAHFFAIAARMMRRVLVDHARRRQAAKRDVGDGERVSITGVPAPAPAVDAVDLLVLHDALTALSELDPRQSEIVEMKYFGGLTVEEIAEVLGISVSSVKREWTTAKVWLRHRMQGH